MSSDNSIVYSAKTDNHSDVKTIRTSIEIEKNSIPIKKKESRDYLGFSKLTLISFAQLISDCMIPIMIGVFTLIIMKNNQDINEQNRLADQQNAYILGNNTLFNQYSRDVIDFQIKLGSTTAAGSVATRVFTVNTIEQLSLHKKRAVVQYLYDLLDIEGSISQYKSVFTGSSLNNVDFSDGHFFGISIMRASLINTSFVKTNLQKADFRGSLMTNANFSYAQLDRAFFLKTQLQNADFTGAVLMNAFFIESNLTGALLNDEQLSQALYITNAILPNGTIGGNKNLIINGDIKEELSHWNTTGNITMNTDLNSEIMYFIGQNNASIFQRVNVTRYQPYFNIYKYCISLYYINNITIFIQYPYSYDESRFITHEYIITPSMGSKIPDFNHYFWSTCREDKLNSPPFVDVHVYFTTSSLNSSNSSMCRDIEFYISHTLQ